MKKMILCLMLAIFCTPSMATSGDVGDDKVDSYASQYSGGTTGNLYGSLVGGYAASVSTDEIIQSVLGEDYSESFFWFSDLGAYTDYGNASPLELTQHDVAQSRGAEGASQPRFVRSDDGSVLDTVTGIRWWLDTPWVTKTWAEAKAYCADLTTPGGYDNWSLPEEDMLRELRAEGREVSRFRPAEYWSASESYNSSAYTIDFDPTAIFSKNSDFKSRRHYVVCAAIPQPKQTTIFDPNGNHKVDIGDIIVHLRLLAK